MHPESIHVSGFLDDVVRLAKGLPRCFGAVEVTQTHLTVHPCDALMPRLTELSRRNPHMTIRIQSWDPVEGLARHDLDAGHLREVGLMEGWGSSTCDEGEPLEEHLLLAAADQVAARADALGCLGKRTAIADRLALGAALGQLSVAAGDGSSPTPETLDAIRELAAVALVLGVPGAPERAGDARELRRRRLDATVAHARMEALEGRPGTADWQFWLPVVLEGACSAIDMCDDSGAHNSPEAMCRHHRHHDAYTGMLLSTLLQVLVLFDQASAVRWQSRTKSARSSLSRS